MTYNKNTWANHDLITSQKLNNIEDGINDVIDRVTYGTGGAEQPTQPIHTPVYLNLGDPLPTDAVSGDYAFVKDGDDFTILEFNGVKWVEQINPNLKERIADVLTQAETRSQELVDENAKAIGATLDDVKAKQADLTAQQAELDAKAQGYATQALADAKADTLATAQQTAKDAQDALDSAKTALTTSLNKEVTDRANAVSALDTKAQGYATQAKTDAIATANASVAKEVTDRQKAITDLDAKSTTAINQAKTDAQSALDALQVGGRNWLLDSKVAHSATGNNTVNQVNASHSYTLASNMSSGDMFTKFSVGSPFTLSFDWAVTGTTITGGFFPQWGGTPWGFNAPTVALSGTNTSGHYVYVGKIGSTWSGTSARTIQFRMDNVQGVLTLTNAKLEIGNKATDYTQAPEDIVLDYTTKDNVISQSLTQYQSTNDGKVTKAQSDATQALGLVSTKVSQTDYNTKTGDLDSKYTAVKQTADQASTDIVAIKSTNTSQDTKINNLTSDVSGTKQSISDIQTEQGKQSTKINTIQTDVSGTKQDISDIQDANGVQDGKIASISTTVDGLSSSFSTYKTTNDGKVTKAQSDIVANTNAIATKVSQTAYDAKTGQLQTDLNTTTTTANQAKTDIVAIKSDNTKQDARMTTIESDANGVKTTVSNLQTDLGKANGSISTLQQRADGFDATVATLGQINQLFNTEFSPDFAGWVSGDSPLGKWDPSTSVLLQNDSGWALGSGKHSGSNVLKKSFVSGSRSQFSSLPIPVGAGQAVAGSIQAQSTTSYDGNVTARIDFRYYDSTMNYISMDSVSSGKLLRWTTVQMARTTPANTAYIVYVLLTNGTTGNNYYSQPMLTFSNKVGQYVQGNYNNNASVAKAQLTADSASLALSNYKTDADGRISKAQADIIVNANAITQKVSQSDYNAKTGDLTTKVNTAQSTADSATSTIGAYKTANDARVASAESKITANANAITSKVSQTDYDKKTGELSGYISTLKQRADGFDATVTKVNNLAVGGRNYVLNTNVSTTSNITGFYSSVPSSYFNNKKLTVSVQLDYDNITALSGQKRLGVEFVILNKDGSNRYVGSWKYPAVGDSFHGRIYTTWDFSNNEFKDIVTNQMGQGIYVQGITGNNVSVSKPKLEIGTSSTDWSPAPEDTDNKISTVSQTVDSISSIVSDPTTGLTKRIQTAEGSISTVQSNVSDLQSKQTQTANGLTTEISNRATGDTNTLTQAKDFTTSSISNSESGMRSLITQTSDSIIAKVDTKTDSATVLSLLKDNWSIGITGNTNKLASGIAADPSAMAIVSPKVIIDSPKTQITGTAWINSAMIGNGQIGTAQIGDAAITSAKIANLDVSKITGNVTNFIQSNWNGVYESTTITNDGMKIVTSDVTTTFGPYGIKLTQGGESVGGIGVSSYVGMPTNFQGIAFNLDGTGDYMTWSARDSGVTTGDYTTKLAWFRSSYKPIGQNAGFNFSDDSPVTFWGDIYGRENTEPLKIAAFGMHGVSAGGIGHGNGSSAITFGGDGEIYIVSSGKYYKLAQFVKALQPLIGLGTWSAPKNINSSGVVTQWTNITT